MGVSQNDIFNLFPLGRESKIELRSEPVVGGVCFRLAASQFRIGEKGVVSALRFPTNVIPIGNIRPDGDRFPRL